MSGAFNDHAGQPLHNGHRHDIGDAVADLTQIRLARQVRHLHQLVERSLLELLIEFVGIDDNLSLDLGLLLDRYARLTPEMIDRLDGREIRNDLVVVEGGRP